MSRGPRAPTGEDAGSSGNGRPRNEADDSERLLLAPDERPGGTDAPAWLVLGAQATAEVAGARASLQSAHRGRAGNSVPPEGGPATTRCSRRRWRRASRGPGLSRTALRSREGAGLLGAPVGGSRAAEMPGWVLLLRLLRVLS